MLVALPRKFVVLAQTMLWVRLHECTVSCPGGHALHAEHVRSVVAVGATSWNVVPLVHLARLGAGVGCVGCAAGSEVRSEAGSEVQSEAGSEAGSELGSL